MKNDSSAEVLWAPSSKRIAESQLTRFSRWLARKKGQEFPSYQSLHAWSIANIQEFWESYLEFSEIQFSQKHSTVLDTEIMPGARWFSDMELSFCENVLNPKWSGPAIIFSSEASSRPMVVEFDSLRSQVTFCASALKELGIRKGDRVAGYLANVPEAVVAALASSRIGASWASASPDFGLDALCSRLSQVEPKIVFASSHYIYSGKLFRTDDVVNQLRSRLPSINHIITVPYPAGEATQVGDRDWQTFLSGSSKVPELKPERLPFNHPLYILFSSGTTGMPKCMVHGAGGTLLQHLKELQLHCDLSAGDRLLFFTTCGWMMWNWQLTALSLGVTICLFDGNPGHPELASIWKVVDQLGVTHFGTSGRYLESCMKHRPKLNRRSFGRLTKLQTLLYTGSPLSDSGYRWVYETVKPDLHLAGISGGTDIVSCFVLGNPILPVRAGEIQCKGLGVDVVALDEQGHEAVGRAGELVCRKPLPSMPLYFLNDRGGAKYRAAYFESYPGLWRHGDWVEFRKSGGVVIHGRSDATLNPGGVRIGSAEIYAVLDRVGEVTGAMVVGWKPPNEEDELVILCIVLRQSDVLDEDLLNRIKKLIRKECSPRHIPRHIFRISGLPVTRSGKPVELSAKAILAGREISNRDAIANPEILEEFDQIRNTLLKDYAH